MNTGSILGGRPSLGSWVSYGLGTENQNLPGVRRDAGQRHGDGRRRPAQLGRRLHAGRLPGDAHSAAAPSRSPTCDSAEGDRPTTGSGGKLDFLDRLNRRHAADRGRPDRARRPDPQLRAGLPDAGRGARGGRPGATRPTRRRRLYGIDEQGDRRRSAASACWPAGWSSAASGSSSSTAAPAASGTPTPTSRRTTPSICRAMDKPVAGLLKDLKRRGLLDETLVVWGGEFGRTPMSEKGDGRDHNPYGFTMWMAGGGVKGGQHRRRDRRGRPARRSRTACTSTTSTPRSCTCLGLDHMQARSTATRAAPNGRRSTKAKSTSRITG